MEKFIIDNESIRAYLINSLAEGRNDYLDILFLSKKKYWELVSRLPEFYDNVKVKCRVVGLHTYKVLDALHSIIIIKDSRPYDSEYHKILLLNLADKTSEIHRNEIISYSFYNENKEEEAIIMCYKNKKIIEESFVLPKHTDSAIINLTIKKYDEITNSPSLKRVKELYNGKYSR